MFLGSRPISKDKAISSISNMVNSQLGKKHITQAIVYVDSSGYNINQAFAYGNLNGEVVNANQPFHVASVGKAFTATLIGILMEDGKINLDDKITSYLNDNTLDNLFIYEGVDYKDEVTIGQLLNHTSGVADYFEDSAVGSDPMLELAINDQDKFWTPIDLVDFTRNYQSAIGKPGETYHYSDTGYILLGLIIENVSGITFHEMLHDDLLTPLGMDDSYLMFYSEPVNKKQEIADVWLNGVNVKDYQSLSIDWTGGGIISTTSDLAKFVRALNNYKVISQSTLNELYQYDNKFRTGMHYGYGFMEYNFGEFFPTLKSLPNYTGHMGILGTQMFYDKTTDTVYISSFGSTDASASSVQTMIKIISTLERIK